MAALRKIGLWKKIMYFFGGEPESTLEEDRVALHPMVIAQMVVVSIAAIRTFGKGALVAIFDQHANLNVKTDAWIVLIIVGFTVIMSDYAAPRARDYAKLLRMRLDDTQANILTTYSIVVYGIDALTVAMFFWNFALPDVPFLGLSAKSSLILEISMRVVLIGLTNWTLHDVVQKLGANVYTLASRIFAISGGALSKRISAGTLHHPEAVIQMRLMKSATKILTGVPENDKQRKRYVQMLIAMKEMTSILETAKEERDIKASLLETKADTSLTEEQRVERIEKLNDDLLQLSTINDDVESEEMIKVRMELEELEKLANIPEDDLLLESNSDSEKLHAVLSNQNIDLENRYQLPGELTLESELVQADIPTLFGISAGSFNRRYNQKGATLGIFPIPRDGKRYWKVQQILYLYEQGVFDSLDMSQVERMKIVSIAS